MATGEIEIGSANISKIRMVGGAAPSSPASGALLHLDSTDQVDVKRSGGTVMNHGRLATGTYTGDAAATKVITGVGFQPRVLMIYRQTDASAVMATKTDQDGTKSQLEDGKKYKDDHIISLNADGFTVGDGTGDANILNVGSAVYTWIAFG